VAKSKGPNKREIIFRLLEVPDKGRRPFFAREMKMLNDLCERYSLEFMDIVSFAKKFDSLAYLVSDKLKSTLDEKFRAFNFRVDLSKYETYHFGEKVGEDKTVVPKIKTVKDFLDE
jgi:hypothetical protein|tara:strand:- start:24049 stop:24396 length:348 start_codon:yes stop_codon:yes gene_type:complete